MSIIPVFLKNIYIPVRLYIENNYFNFDNPDDLSYILDNIYIGNISTSINKELLKEKGITHILSATSHFMPAHPEDFKYLHIPSYDITSFDLSEFFNQGSEFIKEGTSGNNRILVHCIYGKSRSVSLVISYLMTHKNYKYEDALALVKNQRPVANPNDSFIKQLKELELDIQKREKLLL